MALPYSGAIFVPAFSRECTETFLEGRCRAFEFFGGAPQEIAHDNSAIAIIEVGCGRERTLTKEFLRLQSRCLFQEFFWLVRRANAKKQVERLLKNRRRGSGFRRLLIPWRTGQLREAGARWFEAEFLPAYAPDLNPVEAVWSCTKHVDLANCAPTDLFELGKAAGESFVRQLRDRRMRESYFQTAKLSLR